MIHYMEQVAIAIKIIASDTSQWLSTATEVIRELAAGGR